jgi:flagellar motor protein MotB
LEKGIPVKQEDSEMEDFSISPPHFHVEEEGEPWLVSYADMMTLLFGFFVLMYSFAAAKLDHSSDDWIQVRREMSRFFGSQNKLESEAEKNAGKTASVEDDGAQTSQKGTGMASTPAVPFDSQFRYLATRNELIEEVQSLIEEIEGREKASSPKKSISREVQTELLKKTLDELRKRSKVGNGSQTTTDGDSLRPPEAKDIAVVFDFGALLGQEKGGGLAILTQEGDETLNRFADQLAAFSQTLRVDVEARKVYPNAGTPSPLENQIAFAETSQRALTVAEGLRKHLEKKAAGLTQIRHTFGVAGLGYWTGAPLAAGKSIQDPILVRVSFVGDIQKR